MNAKEKAKQLTRIIHDHYCKDNLRKLTETAIEQAIIAAEDAKAKAIKEECATVCDGIENHYRERQQFEETGGMSTYSADAAQRCAFAIRQSSARSEG